ncbi:MAG: HAD family phosphatase [Ruminococcaceae bacterium]|nr:HAD family phosphatase [Oscillospiraceae bacterium]
MIKLIATDLDGTLLLPDHVSVSDENARALRAASEQGIRIVIASGRTHEVFPAGVRELEFIDYALTSNGSSLMIFDTKTGEPKEQRSVTEMPCDVWNFVYDSMVSAGADPEVYACGKSFMDAEMGDRYGSGLLPDALVAELKSHITFVDDVKETLVGKSAEKVCALTVPEENRASLMAVLENDGRLEITSAIPGNIEVNLKGTSKGRAIAMLCDMLGIMPDEVMAFGDADNDVEMLKYAGFSVAMGNAKDEAKAVCRYVTETNENDGVAKAIYKYAIKPE